MASMSAIWFFFSSRRRHTRPLRDWSSDVCSSDLRGPFLQEPCLPLGVDPIHSYADTYDQRDSQLGSPLHMAFYQLCGGFPLPGRYFKYKFVMDLQYHARRKPPLLQAGGDPDHGDLDQVRSRALERGVGSSSLAERSDVVVAVLQLGYVAPPSEQCLDVPLFARLGHGAIEPDPDTREPREVLLDESLRVILGDAELAGQGEWPLPVDRGEVDRLRAGAHVRRDLVVRHAEDERRSLAVDVPALLEGFDERRVAREMGQQSQLDLRVVGREQQRPGRSDEGAANGFAARGAHRDILQVRVGRRQPARGSPGLIEARVDAPGLRVDESRQRIHVGGLELR